MISNQAAGNGTMFVVPQRLSAYEEFQDESCFGVAMFNLRHS